MNARLFRHLLLCLALLAPGFTPATTVPGASGTQVSDSASSSGCHETGMAETGCPHGGGDICLCAANSAALAVQVVRVDARPAATPRPLQPPLRLRPPHDQPPLRPPS